MESSSVPYQPFCSAYNILIIKFLVFKVKFPKIIWSLILKQTIIIILIANIYANLKYFTKIKIRIQIKYNLNLFWT